MRQGARASNVPDSNVKLCCVIKQDGYGLGAVRLSKRLASLGADLLAVYCEAEARALVDVPISTPILCLMPVYGFDRHDPLYRLAVRERLELTLHSPQQGKALIDLAAKFGFTIPVHVQVDVGMSRGGTLPDQALELVKWTLNQRGLRLAGLMTHFSNPSADEAFTKEQARLFRSWIDATKPLLAEAARRGQPPVVVHAANTAAMLRNHNLHGTMVRIGQGMLGYGGDGWPEDQLPEFSRIGGKLEHAMRWISRIVHVQEIPAGWPVGYDRTFVSERPTKIALVPVGYADGYPRSLSNRAVVRLTGLPWDRPRTMGPMEAAPETGVQGVYARVIGRVSMDQITIDVTDLPDSIAGLGMEVEVVGSDKEGVNSLPILAALCGTITHEMLTGLSPHLERVYVASNVGGADEAIEPLAKVSPVIITSKAALGSTGAGDVASAAG